MHLDTSVKTQNRNSRIIGVPSQPSIKLKSNSNGARMLHMETKFLNRLIVCGQKGILSHPVIESFLELKWGKAKSIFYASFLFHVSQLLLIHLKKK